MFLDYTATHSDAKIRYRASDMFLMVHSDASYLTESKARSRAGGYFFLTGMPADPLRQPLATDPTRPNNGCIHTECRIMKMVVASAAEAEMGALHYNAGEACSFRTALEEMGHKQPPAHIQVDNSTVAGISNNTVKQKRSKAMDMRFYWILDRIRQGQFQVFWNKGSLNLGDYHTKHQSSKHHIEVRSTYLHTARANFAHAFSKQFSKLLPQPL